MEQIFTFDDLDYRRGNGGEKSVGSFSLDAILNKMHDYIPFTVQASDTIFAYTTAEGRRVRVQVPGGSTIAKYSDPKIKGYAVKANNMFFEVQDHRSYLSYISLRIETDNNDDGQQIANNIKTSLELLFDTSFDVSEEDDP